MDPNAPTPPSAPETGGAEVTKTPEKVKFGFLPKIHLPAVKNIILPVSITVIILVVGGGGTYFVASSFLAPKNKLKIAENNSLQVSPAVLPTPTSTPSPTPTVIPTPTLDVTPTPSASAAAGWTHYFFAGGSLSFFYPPDWFVDLADTSGAPYLHVQNFKPTGSLPINQQNQYSILVSRLDEVGIASLSALLDDLSQKASSSVFLEGTNMGTVSVLSGNSKTINGYTAYERTVSYSNFPTSQYYELYVLDGKSNVIRFLPELDTAGGSRYFNTLISTISFVQ